MAQPSYIQQDRHGGFHFVRKVPVILRDHFDTIHIRRSLHTHHRPTAIIRARRIAAYLDRATEKMKSKYERDKLLAKARANVADAIIEEITRDLEHRLTPEQRKILNDPEAVPDEDLQRIMDESLEQVAHQEQLSTTASFDHFLSV